MKNEATPGADERSKLEERIIAHFDGSMDDASSKSLMEEVMASPEKRALFRAHETLNRVIASARAPMESPLETRREIADRIPGLIAFIPGLLGTAVTAPVIQQAANPILAFFTRMSLTTALSIGSAVAVLTTVGILATNSGNNVQLVSPKPSIAQQSVSSQSASQSSVPQNVASQSTAQRNVAANAANVANASMVSHSAKTVANMTSPSGARHASSIARAAKSANDATSNIADAGKSSAIPVALDNNNSGNDGGNNGLNSNGLHSNSDRAPGSEPVSTVPPIANSNTQPKPSAPIVANNPIQSQILMPIPDDAGEGITVRPYVSNATRFIQTSVLNVNGQPSWKYQNSSQNYTGGLEFDLGDRWAFHVQGGYNGFADVIAMATNIAPPPSLLSTPMAIYGPSMTINNAWWTTAGASYTFVTPFMPIYVSGDAGTAFGSSSTLMAMASLGTEISLGGPLAIRPLLTFDLVKMSTSPVGGTPNNAIYEAPSVSSMWVNAFGFQLNFVYRP